MVMNVSELVTRPIRASEREQAANLVASIFGAGDVQRFNAIYHRFMSVLPQHPGDRLHHYHGVFQADRLVSFAHLTPEVLRYGNARLRVGGIGAVCTHPDVRGQGFAALVIRSALTYAAEQGIQLVLLNAIPDYYDRFGFMSVWPRYTLQAPVEAARALEQVLELRMAFPEDLPQVARLYKQHWQSRITFTRSPAVWRWRLASEPESLVLAVDAQDRVQGYIWHRNEFTERVEVVADTPEAVQTLLHYSGERWHYERYETLTWSIPPDDVVIPHAQQMLPITLQAHYAPRSGWMARLIDTSALLNALLPEIIAQATAAAPGFDPQQLIVQVESDGVTVGLKTQPQSRCRLSLRDFVQILFGSLRPSTLAVRQSLHRESIALLELLFPPRVAALGPWDWF